MAVLELESINIAWHHPHKVMLPDGYDGIEWANGQQETGYLTLKPGELVVPNTEGAVDVGHAENKFTHYTYGHKYGQEDIVGWFPVQAIMLQE